MAATRKLDRGARIAVCVSGAGSNLAALRAREKRGTLGGSIALVVGDRPCGALAYAADEGLSTALVDPSVHEGRAAWDEALASTLLAADVDLVVLAGFMRVLGPGTLAAFAGRILNVHPSLLPAFPGAHAVRDALAAGVRVTGVTVHLVDDLLDGGPIVAQEPVLVLPGDDAATLLSRLHTVEHRLLPRAVALTLGGAVTLEGRRVTIDDAKAAEVPRQRRALLSVSDKTGLAAFGGRLAGLGFELVSTGGTARALRGAGLAVTDVAEVTGFPEMLDGRVKTLHPRVSAGVLADLRLVAHREQLAAAAIEPFELVVVNLYPFAEAAAREDATLDELVEQIDIGGPTLVRAAAKNHASVGIVTDPAQYDAVVAEIGHGGGLTEDMRRELALAAFKLTAAYDALISTELADRWYAALPAADAGQAPEPPATIRLRAHPAAAAALRREPAPIGGPLPGGRARPCAGDLQRRRRAAAGQAAQLQQHSRHGRRHGRGARPARRCLRRGQARQPVRRGRGRRSPLGVGTGTRRRPGQRVRRRGRRDAPARRAAGRAADPDVPRGRGRAGLLGGGAGRTGAQAEPARVAGPGPRRAAGRRFRGAQRRRRAARQPGRYGARRSRPAGGRSAVARRPPPNANHSTWRGASAGT